MGVREASLLRLPKDEAERRLAETGLRRAADLMEEALAVLDGTPVATGCDGCLDQALHDLRAAIGQVEAGAAVFTDGTFDERRDDQIKERPN